MRLSAGCWLCIGLAAACSEETSPRSSTDAGTVGPIVDSGTDAPAHTRGGNGGAVGGGSAAGGRPSEPADAMLDGGPPDVSGQSGSVGAGGSAEIGTHHDADARTGDAEAGVQD